MTQSSAGDAGAGRRHPPAGVARHDVPRSLGRPEAPDLRPARHRCLLRGRGLPGWLAYLTFAAEAAGGLALVLGVQARWVALALSPFLLGALFTVHAGNGWVFTAPGGGWEYPAYLFVLCLAQVLLGDGASALVPSTPLGRLLGRPAPQPCLG